MKYEILQDQSIVFDGHTLYRIRAVHGIPERTMDSTNYGEWTMGLSGRMDMWHVKPGELGGWVEGPHNLSQTSSAWIAGNAKVYGRSRVSSGGLVKEGAIVRGKSSIYRGSTVYGEAIITNSAVCASRIGGQTMLISCHVGSNTELDGAGDWQNLWIEPDKKDPWIVSTRPWQGR